MIDNNQAFVLIWFFVAHFIGDFLLQPSILAKRKHNNLLALSVHVFIYTFCFIPTSLNNPLLILAVGIPHLITDFFTSKLTHKYAVSADDAFYHWAETRKEDWLEIRDRDIRSFFIAIGLDQMLHMISLVTAVHFLNPIGG